MRPGEQLTLQIDNEMEYGYFLTDGEDSVLLHRSEMTEDIGDRDEVEVYLYVDHEERLAKNNASASTKMKLLNNHVFFIVFLLLI
ncbi:S1-like domain-containing RNA-binding protein [Escherichia coli]|nr:S1-like domain-containing RNA-binding protein [Escherichia coli]